jgi:branched-chain amino acid transport system substrate-binding protein
VCWAARLELVERDDEAKTSAAFKSPRADQQGKVTATVGYINTGVALASQRFFQEAKIPVMNNVATAA